MVRKFGEIGAFGPTVPQQYGGGGLDYISYGNFNAGIERGDSVCARLPLCRVPSMYPIYKFGSEEQRKNIYRTGQWMNGWDVLA